MEPITFDTKRILAIAAAIGILLTGIAAVMAAGTYGASIEPTSYRSFTVTGEGTSIGVPDIATFSFSVITEGGTDVGVLQKENTEKTNAAIAFVKEHGIAKEDITTSGYNVSPRYQSYTCAQPTIYGGVSAVAQSCPPAKIVGYTVTQTVTVKVRDFTKIGTVLAGVVEHGANSVSSLSFAIDKPDVVESAARTEAIEKARVKAEAVAKAGGFSVGRILSIDEGYITPSYNRAMSFDTMATGKAAEMSIPTVEPGSQEVIVNVSMRFEIK
ncbi:MAG: SIMPL domain-containing protein [Candidatus Yonathbacteria bacterium]|nr:SIMPL domain-containing protein [Candidatus Yonathbacteria bacterium]